MTHHIHINKAPNPKGTGSGHAWRIECDGERVCSGWVPGPKTAAKAEVRAVMKRLGKYAQGKAGFFAHGAMPERLK